MTDHTKLAALVAKWREDAAKYRSRQAECTDKNNHESATQWRLAAQDCETHIHELEAALAAEHSGAVEPKGDLLDPDAIATVCRDLGELESDGWIVAGVARKIIQLATTTQPVSVVVGDGWRPIESAPRDGTRVVTRWKGVDMKINYFNSHAGVARGYRLGSEDWWESRKDQQPDEWYPLPAFTMPAAGDAT